MSETTIDGMKTTHIAAERVARRLRLGDEIRGRYVVESELGQGGMGVVYQCFDRVGSAVVAVKGLPPEVSHNVDEMEEVRDNYRLVEGLRHPNICGVKTLEMDEHGDYYLVMNLARGENLNRWQRKHPDATDAQKIAILRQIAAALDYAHARNIIHRDVKPENVMVDEDGTALVLDFGIAAQVRSSQAVTSHSGSPGYKAPEQWLGQSQEAAADQYALGVITYKLFAGRLPFDGEDLAVLGQAVLNAPVPQIASASAAVNAALAKALSKKSADRFPSCMAFVDALDGGTSAEKPRPVSASSPKGDVDIYLVEVKAKDLFERKVAKEREPTDATLKDAFRQLRFLYSAATSALSHGDQVSARRLFGDFSKSVADYEAAVAEAERKAEEAHQAKQARQREEKRKAEEARQAELARQREEKRKAEETRLAELARQREEKRKAEEARKAEQARRRVFRKVSAASVALVVCILAGLKACRAPEFPEAFGKEAGGLARGGTQAGEVATLSLPQGVKMTFVWCPAGMFTMGSPSDEVDWKPNETLHQVTLTKGFWMGQFEVTQAQWESVMGDNPSHFKGDDNRPVELVSWHDCTNFIAKCNKAAKGVTFALPTEAQWEYARRAGSTGSYAGTGDLDEMGWYSGNSGGTTHPVGRKRPNAWNLYDMHGNVWEWCADCYDKDFYTREVAKVDPCCASGSNRVLRGGSWGNDALCCRSAYRSYNYPSNGSSRVGFRLCCSAGLH